MPSVANVVKRFTRQTLVYWAKNSSDKFGRPTFAAGVEVKCRWEDKEQEIILPDKRKVMGKGYLLLASPLEVGSLVWLGTLVQWAAESYYPALPNINQGGREIIINNTTPDLKAQGFVYESFFD